MGGEGGLGAGMCECFEAAYLIQFQVDFTQNAEGDKLKVKITSRKRKIVTFTLKFLSVSITQPCQLRSFKSCSDYCVGFTFASRSKKS